MLPYALIITRPPEQGAAFGDSVVTPMLLRASVFGMAHSRLRNLATTTGLLSRDEADGLASAIDRVGTAEAVSHPSGIVVRLVPQNKDGALPHACPCCGALVMPSAHAYAGADDAYCTGYFTWDRKVPACLPSRSAHANPWTTDSAGARFCMEVSIDQDGETGHDVRYSRTDSFDGMWDEKENALIAWPGLTEDQLISVTITEIQKD